MKHCVEFDRATVHATAGLQNKFYAWSKQHNITFMENNTVDGVRLHFGRASELSIFLLTWDSNIAKPRVV